MSKKLKQIKQEIAEAKDKLAMLKEKKRQIKNPECHIIDELKEKVAEAQKREKEIIDRLNNMPKQELVNTNEVWREIEPIIEEINAQISRDENPNDIVLKVAVNVAEKVKEALSIDRTPKKPDNINGAMAILRHTLATDEGYRISWEASIAMAFIDQCGKMNNNRNIIRELAKEAAKNFIDELIN